MTKIFSSSIAPVSTGQDTDVLSGKNKIIKYLIWQLIDEYVQKRCKFMEPADFKAPSREAV